LVVVRDTPASRTVFLEQLRDLLAGLEVRDHEQTLPLAEAGARSAPDRADDSLDFATQDGLRLVSSDHAPSPQDVLEIHRARVCELIRRRIIVRGHVQGVFFRDSMHRLAWQREVSGWVANRRDGTVEAVLEGDGGAVERLIEFAHRGPRGAQVESVDVFNEEPEGLTGFSVR
jgi:acylphosphatase